MIFEDKLVALLKNPGYVVSQGHRLYEIDPYGLMYFPERCIDSQDPSVSPGDCSTDSKRSLDNYSYFNIGQTPQGLFNFANINTEDIVDIYIDQATSNIIYLQSSTSGNYTKIYLSPFQQIERRTVTAEDLPEYIEIGTINAFVAIRSFRESGIIYAIDNIPGSQRIYKIALSIDAENYNNSSIDVTLEATYTGSPSIIDMCYDRTREKIVALSGSDLLYFDSTWISTPIPNNTGYIREHKCIAYDYINDLYIIGNLSGVGSSYDYRGPTRTLLNPDNILNDAAIFTILKAGNLDIAYDVPYITIDNIQQYRYPLIFPLDNPSKTPTLPYKTYCNISKMRFFDMNGIARLVGRDEFIYQVLSNYQTGELYPDSSFIHRSLVTYSSYATQNNDIIDGVLSILATTDQTNAVSTDQNLIPQWISFDYGSYVDPDCSKVLINNIKICHERAAKCVGADNLITNGDFLEGVDGWTDLNNNTFPDPFDPNIWTESNNTIRLDNIGGIKQSIVASGLIDIRIKIDLLGPAIDQNASLIIKFYEGAQIVYEEEIKNSDLDVVPFIWSSDFAVEASAFSIELGPRATSAILDYILICDIQGEKSCKPGYQKISYDSFIENNGQWTLASDAANLCGEQPTPPQPVPPAIPPPPTLPNSFDAWYSSLEGIFHFGYLAGNTAPVLYLQNNQINNPGNVTENSIMGVTLDKVNKKVYWLEKKYPIGASFADGILHVADQTDVTSDRILTTLQGIGFPGGGENVRTVHQRFAHYGAFICYVTFKDSWQGTGPTKLVVLNTEGQELRSTNLDAILPNSRTYFKQLTIDKDSIYISGEEVINGQIRSVVLRINATSLLLIGKYYYTNSLSGNRPYISMINGPMTIDHKNKFIYFCDTLDNYFGSNQSNQGGLFRINTEAIVGTLPGEGYTQRFILGSNPIAKLPVIAMDVDRDGNLLVWRYIRENNTIKYIISLVRVADLSITDLPLSPSIPPNTIYPSPCCDPLVPEQTWPPIFANAQ